MTVQRFFGLLIGLIVLVSCEKENYESGNDLKIQKFWKLSGYYDGNGNQINEPGFDPDILFHYEVNLIFLWNDYSQRYEIQGQGPFDIFWGEYLTPGDNILHLRTLETTNTISDFDELNSYDSLFFHTLSDVANYSVENDKLKLFYGNESKYLLFEIKTEQYLDAGENIIAEINGMNWKGNPAYTSAHVAYNYDTELFNFSLGGTSQEILSDSLSYDISFSINLPPVKGKFDFNNDGAVINTRGGVLGNCYGKYKDQYHIDTRSTSGIIAITRLTRSFIEGYFYFDATGIGEDIGVNYTIRNGNFLIRLNSPSSWFQKYEFVD